MLGGKLIFSSFTKGNKKELLFYLFLFLEVFIAYSPDKR